MRGIFWVGLTGLAAVGGAILHSDDIETYFDGSDRAVIDVDARVDRSLDRLDRRIAGVDRMIADIDRRVDRAIDGSNPAFVEQMEALEEAIESGAIDQGEAIDLAIDRVIAQATGNPLPPLPPTPRIPQGSTGLDRLDQAEQQVEGLRDAGVISQEDYSSIVGRISEARARAE